jgi:hypothetical protein
MRTDATEPQNSGKGPAGRLSQETRCIAEAGVCRTCRHKLHCTVLANASKPIIECEQFEVVSAVRRPVPELGEQVYSADPDRRFFGLCMNCEHRDTCLFARRNGGVWHCEEYA